MRDRFMRAANVYFDLADTSVAVFDRPIEWMLAALLAFLPAVFGGVLPWSEGIFIAVAIAMGLALAGKLLVRPDVPFVRSWTYWPIGLFLALIVLQLVPLPAGVVRVISPATVSIRHEYLDELPGASDRLRWMTLSLYPENTLHDLRLIVALAIVFVVTLNCVRRVSQVRRILATAAIVGAAVASMALVQDLASSDAIYFRFRSHSSIARGGPFENRNHFGQFMNLAVGCAIGLGLVIVNQQFRRDNYTAREVAAKLKTPQMRPVWLVALMVVMSLAAIVLSLSRGAMLGAAVAGSIVGLFVATRRNMPGRAWTLLAVLLCVGFVTIGQIDRIVERFTGAAATDSWSGHRIEILRDLSAAWRKFPLLGTGLGTHPVIFPMLDRSDVPLFATHAENEYAQLMTETGLAGVAIVVAFVAIIGGALLRATRGLLSPASAAAIGLAYGLIAVLVQSATDFAQHTPAVAVLTAVSCALALNLAELRWRERGQVSPALPRRGSLLLRAAAMLMIGAAGAWAIREAHSAWRADSAWRVVQRIDRDLQRRDWRASNAEYADILDAASTAARLRPLSVEYRYWLNFYRYQSVSRLRDKSSGDVLMTEAQRDIAARIAEELHAGRWLCPTHGPTYLLAGQIERFILDRRRVGAAHIFTGYLLSGADPTAAYIAGQVAASDGDEQASMQYLRRAAKLNPALIGEITGLYIRQLKRPELALEAVGDDVPALNALAVLLAKEPDPAPQALAERARQKAFESLQALARLPNASGETLATLAHEYETRDQYEQAVACYRRALSFEFGRTDWRMRIAHALQKLGRNEEARHELEAVLRLRPRFPEAVSLMEELAVSRASSSSPDSHE